MITDYHAHFIPPSCLDHEFVLSTGRRVGWRVDPATGEVWIDGRLRGLRGAADQPWMHGEHSPLWDLEARLPDLDRAGIERQVISPPPYTCLYELPPSDGWRAARKFNEGIAEAVSGHPDRFVGFATVPLQDPAMAAREAEYVVKQLRLRGLEILTHVNGHDFDEPQFLSFWETVARLQVPVFIHPHAPTDAARLSRYYLVNLIGNPTETALACAHLIFGGVLDRFPGLRFVLAHGGGSVPYISTRWEHGQECIPESRTPRRPLREYFGSLFFDTIAYRPEALRFLVDRVGVEQVVLGTDYPYDMGDPDPIGSLQRVPGLTEAQRSSIAHRSLFAGEEALQPVSAG